MLHDLKSQLGSSMHTVRRFLERPINVKEGNLTLGVAASSLRAQVKDEQRQHVRRMQRDLEQLLGQHPSSRQLMRHLDLLERTLKQRGWEAVDKLPVRVIAKSLVQLEKLVWDWSPVGLAELRSRLAVIVKSRPMEAARESISTAALELDFMQRADVSEVDHATFEEMERSWNGQMPAAVAAAQRAAA